jgi:hypothetical protein
MIEQIKAAMIQLGFRQIETREGEKSFTRDAKNESEKVSLQQVQSALAEIGFTATIAAIASGAAISIGVIQSGYSHEGSALGKKRGGQSVVEDGHVVIKVPGNENNYLRFVR